MSSAPKKQIRVVMPEPLYQQIKRHSGGNQTRFILEAVKERLRQVERQKLEEDLEEGYRVRASEHRDWVAEVAPLYGEVLNEPPPHA